MRGAAGWRIPQKAGIRRSPGQDRFPATVEVRSADGRFPNSTAEGRPSAQFSREAPVQEHSRQDRAWEHWPGRRSPDDGVPAPVARPVCGHRRRGRRGADRRARARDRGADSAPAGHDRRTRAPRGAGRAAPQRGRGDAAPRVGRARRAARRRWLRSPPTSERERSSCRDGSARSRRAPRSSAPSSSAAPPSNGARRPRRSGRSPSRRPRPSCARASSSCATGLRSWNTDGLGTTTAGPPAARPEQPPALSGGRALPAPRARRPAAARGRRRGAGREALRGAPGRTLAPARRPPCLRLPRAGRRDDDL